MSRSNLDFSKHELEISYHKEGMRQYVFGVPGTSIYRFIFTIIDTPLAGHLIVSGDCGNWMFCRIFDPIGGGEVSDSYWCEKLRLYSTQQSHEYDSTTAEQQIDELLNNDDPDDPMDDETREWLQEVRSSASGNEYEYVAAAMNHPASYDMDGFPSGKRLNVQLAAVFDAFEEVARRLKEQAKG